MSIPQHLSLSLPDYRHQRLPHIPVTTSSHHDGLKPWGKINSLLPLFLVLGILSVLSHQSEKHTQATHRWCLNWLHEWLNGGETCTNVARKGEKQNSVEPSGSNFILVCLLQHNQRMLNKCQGNQTLWEHTKVDAVRKMNTVTLQFQRTHSWKIRYPSSSL